MRARQQNGTEAEGLTDQSISKRFSYIPSPPWLRACRRAGWVSMLLLEWLGNAVQPPGSTHRCGGGQGRLSRHPLVEAHGTLGLCAG